jgi:hypothetical protein
MTVQYIHYVFFISPSVKIMWAVHQVCLIITANTKANSFGLNQHARDGTPQQEGDEPRGDATLWEMYRRTEISDREATQESIEEMGTRYDKSI